MAPPYHMQRTEPWQSTHMVTRGITLGFLANGDVNPMETLYDTEVEVYISTLFLIAEVSL